MTSPRPRGRGGPKLNLIGGALLAAPTGEALPSKLLKPATVKPPLLGGQLDPEVVAKMQAALKEHGGKMQGLNGLHRTGLDDVNGLAAELARKRSGGGGLGPDLSKLANNKWKPPTGLPSLTAPVGTARHPPSPPLQYDLAKFAEVYGRPGPLLPTAARCTPLAHRRRAMVMTTARAGWPWGEQASRRTSRSTTQCASPETPNQRTSSHKIPRLPS